jgi:two-component system alkaline phosphatase synthesis response regulator PhoP
MMKTILIVDDKLNALRMLTDYLTENGFRTVTASNGREALYVARHEKPDLVLLDIMMPEMDGLEFMRHFRKERQTPVIMLTARVEETDKVVGLELGADDYVTKPFGMAELVARIRAVMRRSAEPTPAVEVIRVGSVTLDKGSHLVQVEDRKIELTPSEFDLLTVLMSAPGQVFTRTQLLERLKGDLFENVERTVDVHVRNLRAKLEPDPAHPQYIMTVFGVGYRFSGESD